MRAADMIRAEVSMLRICSLSLALLLASCSDAELVGIHIALQKDGSGTMTARALQATAVPGPAESRAKGIEWQVRANLVSSQGTFASLASVELGDREVRFLQSNEDMPRLRVVLQRKKDLAWVKTLVPDEATRKSLAKVHDPNSNRKEIADAIRFEVKLPEQVIASGVMPLGRGVEASHERNRAYLVLPVAAMLVEDEDLVWDVSWK
jgi:hypothetical protein